MPTINNGTLTVTQQTDGNYGTYVPTTDLLPGTNVLSENFENGTIGALGQQSWFAHSIQVVSAASGDAPPSSHGGGKVLRFELRPTDTNPNGKYRAEVHSGFSGVLDATKTNWCRWYYYLPIGFTTGNGNGSIIIGQIHGNTDASFGGEVPQTVINIKNRGSGDEWRVNCRYNNGGIATQTNINTGVYYIGDMSERGRWVKIEVQFKASFTNNGVSRVWIDDTLIAERTDLPIGLSETKDPYFKTGIYQIKDTTLITFVDDIRINTV